MTEPSTVEARDSAIADTNIALVGMAGRFPGSADVPGLWAALRAGESGITRFTEAQLLAAGVPAQLLADPNYVRAGAVIEGVDRFDAGFFGVNPKEAQILDPQHRLFLEHSWHALEDAGCDPARFDGAIGVFGGCAWSSYLTANLNPAGVAREVGDTALALANEKDTLATRVAHLLGLSGPAFTVQSACSTSLVAVCVAAGSLANFECDLALAGGVSISVPQRVGYLYQPGGIASPDGECRAFDASGLGAALGSGVGVVALRRLADALADGDRVYAVLRGWAVNNDAGKKVGFTAPGVQGQAAVIAEALAAAGLRPGDLDYVEAHGTGTALGDAAELAALQRVFRGEAVRIGSVKTNLGHLDRAAGVTGLIKTALALHHGEIPPTRNLTDPNPQLESCDAALSVVTEPWPWPRGERPRRAGVSAFGIGGTNAHVVIEEAPPRPAEPRAPHRPELLIWSARSAAAADQATDRLAGHLETTEDELADIAHTLKSGRAAFRHRRMVVAGSPQSAAALLRGGAVHSAVASGGEQPIGFLINGADAASRFPGPVLAELYRDEEVFRAELDRCRAILAEHGAADPLAGLANPDGAAVTDVAVFAAAYALAQLVRSRGVEPSVLVGYGVGEYVAACLSGVLPLRDALGLLTDPDRLNGTDLTDWAAAHGTSPTPGIAWISGAAAEQGTVLLQLLPGAAGETGSRVLPMWPDDADPVSAAAVLAEAAGRLWLEGVSIDWTRARPGHRPRRVTLPGYPFQPERYWIDPPALASAASAEAADAQVELLTQAWQPADASVPAPAQQRTGGAHHLIVPDAGGVGQALAALLRRAGQEVTVAPGAESLAGFVDGAANVVDLSPLDHCDTSCDAAAVVASVARTLAALAGDGTETVRVLTVTRGGRVVTGTESASPAQAAVAVLPVVARQEYLNLDSRSFDLDRAYGIDDAAEAIAAELALPQDVTVLTASRAGRRFMPDYEPVPVPPRPVASVRNGGSYLITGGLGSVGLLLAGHLAARGAARIVLTSRTGLPEDAADSRTAAVTRLRALGTQVLTPCVDVTDRAAMRELFAGTRFDGVLHAAADSPPEAFVPLSETAGDAVARHFGAKVEGAKVLASVLDELPAERTPDWCVLFSSTSAVLGGVTFGAYAAANAALTALAGTRTPGGTRWIAAAWDTWPGTLHRLDGRLGASMAAHAMSETAALSAFERVLALGASAVIAAAGGLSDRLPAARRADPPRPAPAAQRFPRPDLPQPYAPPLSATERELAEVWSSVLGVEPVGTHDNFFDLSGNSLIALQMLAMVKERFGIAIPTVSLFELPTVRALAALLDRPAAAAPSTMAPLVVAAPTMAPVEVQTLAPLPPAVPVAADDLERHIAIVGMAGRFPGAGDVERFWRNLCDGVESISFFSPEELIAAGVDPETVRDPAYVPARPVLEEVAGFDAAFFGLSPRMAALTDPQQRLFLEVCWEALEQSGYARPEHRGRVGVYGGSNLSTYLLGMMDQFAADPDVSMYELVMGNDKDALTTTVSYLFDLRGPSVAVQTFCSTSLVAVHTAVRALRAGDCEMALAGGVSIRVPDRIGHVYTPGGMESPDGHVRAFDARSEGSMFGDGATVVVLKRLDAALRDGDHIWSVIRGSAMNNDGALKVGYTAPSVVGQAAVIADALADARVRPEDVGYVETHGTGTKLGDPIEMAALTRAFGPTESLQYCPIGSVKTNVGHLDRAAGTAGLIKTSLVLREGLIPPTLHYTSPNPEIDFEHSPFYVNAKLSAWPDSPDRPRIAGLNSLGMGGTNVHVVVTQPPQRERSGPADPDTARRYQVLPVSARTAPAVEQAVRRLGEHLRERPETRLDDAAFTLQVGRRTFEHRRVVVAADLAAAVATLTGAPDARPPAGRTEPVLGRPVAFLFAGVGEQYPGMVGELYRREPVFRAYLDACVARVAELLGPAPAGGGAAELTDLLTGARRGGADLASLLGRATASDACTEALQRTEIVQPLMFAVEYSIASTLMAWGVRPSMMLGYSLGEYVAACLSGVLELDDALALVAHRARLIAEVEPGAMAAVQLPAAQLAARFALAERGLDIAAINGPELAVVAGPAAAVDRLAADLRAQEIACRPLRTTHAFHSRMLAPLAEELTGWIARNIRLHPPTLPYLSDVTGAPVDAALVCDPAYWARHMCEPVLFGQGAAQLLADEQLAVIEIGPGPSLGALLRSAGAPPERWPLITATLPAADDPQPADAVFADCLARLWLLGVEIDWNAHHGRDLDAAAPGRIPLPTYPFERQRYWIERTPATAARAGTAIPGAAPGTALEQFDRIPLLPEEQWIHLPVWRQTAAAPADPRTPSSWLVFAAPGAADRVLDALRRATAPTGVRMTVVRPGEAYRHTDEGWTIRPGNPDDTTAMLRALRADGVRLDRVVHLWTAGAAPAGSAETLDRGLHTLVELARSAGELGQDAWSLDIVTTGAQRVLEDREARPNAATLIGPALVIPMEYASVGARLIDVDPDPVPAEVVAELLRPPTARKVALRAGRRWVCGYEAVEPAAPEQAAAMLRERGVYLITGGLGGIGLAMAERLARDCGARLVLFGRRGLPPREQWAQIAAGTVAAPEHVRERVAKVLEIVGLGGQVEIVVGDVAEPADVRRAVEAATRRFGALHGVLHTAGVPGTGLMQFKKPGDAAQVLAPKIAGTRAIDEALGVGGSGEIELDFLVLFSSITSVTGGGPGQVDYCAGNAYLDAYAAQHSAAGRRVLSVAWGEWTWNAWDGGLGGYAQDVQDFFRNHRATFGIGFEEGWRTLLRALACGESHVVVSTQDLTAVVEIAGRFTVDAVTSVGAPPAAGGAAAGADRHPRPELLTPFQEPSGPVEETIAEAWCASLRLQRVGVIDNYFELGGTSLLSINLLATLRRSFPDAQLPPHVIFEAPTVAALAKTVEQSAARSDAPADPPRAGESAAQAAELRRAGQRAAAARRRRP